MIVDGYDTLFAAKEMPVPVSATLELIPASATEAFALHDNEWDEPWNDAD